MKNVQIGEEIGKGNTRSGSTTNGAFALSGATVIVMTWKLSTIISKQRGEDDED
jgi:hypothetical protein